MILMFTAHPFTTSGTHLDCKSAGEERLREREGPRTETCPLYQLYAVPCITEEKLIPERMSWQLVVQLQTK